jgi:hypothetical protein
MTRFRLAVPCSAALIGVLVGMAGCGQGQPGGTGASTADASPTPAGTCPAMLSLTEADNQTSVCVATGATLELTLRSVPGQPWASPEVSSDVLTPTGTPQPVPDGFAVVYRAVRAGTAVITSSRSACPPPTAGAVACQALLAFRLTVQVVG